MEFELDEKELKKQYKNYQDKQEDLLQQRNMVENEIGVVQSGMMAINQLLKHLEEKKRLGKNERKHMVNESEKNVKKKV